MFLKYYWRKDTKKKQQYNKSLNYFPLQMLLLEIV